MSSSSVGRTCASCGTGLAPAALVCPACQALVHAQTLRTVAAQAEALAREERWDAARAKWERALSLLPADSRQHAIVAERVAEMTRRASPPAEATPAQPASGGGWGARVAGTAGAVALLLMGKLKFLLLGLSKASTLLSMVAFFGVYWSTYGWPLALGLVLSIYIHEMGHVAEIKRQGLDAGAPLFIPGVGALVMLKTRITDPVNDARVGLAGPIWGLGAALLAWGVWQVTHVRTWLAISELGGFINLFNLIPVWQLDGSRGFHALSRWQRAVAVGIVAVAFLLTRQKMLVIVGAVGLFRLFGKDETEGHLPTLATYGGLAMALGWLARHAR